MVVFWETVTFVQANINKSENTPVRRMIDFMYNPFLRELAGSV